MNFRMIRSIPFSLLALFIIYGCGNNRSAGFTDDKLDTNRLVKVQLAANLDEPMEIAITNEGRVILVERKGAVKMFLPEQNSIKLLATMPVYSGQEDGLLGVALDPQYAVNNHVYFYYSPVGEKPIQRVSRFKLVKDSLELGSEKILLEIPTQREECCHSAGSLAFGPDGNLFIAVGDNTNPHNPGYYNSIDERKGRESWDAQRTAGNTNDFRGKILRIHPEADGTYTIPKGNLFPQGKEGTKPEIYVMGCRNPYRISVDMKKGWLYWGDVGQNTIDNPQRGPISYDEWNVATEPGFFGWPYFAGPNSPYADFDFETEKTGPFFNPQKPENTSVNNTGLKDLPAAKEAMIWYSYDESKIFPHLGNGGKSPIGGPVFYTDAYSKKINDTTTHLHSYYNNKVFIAEWMRDWINVLTVNEKGKVDSVEPFMKGTRFNHPIDLEIGPDGVLYVLEYGTFWFAKNKDAGLYRIEYQRGNRAPVVQMNADKTAGSNPLTVQFSSQGTFDPDSSALTYKWYFDKDEVQSSDSSPVYTFNKPGTYHVKLVVSDAEGRTREKTIEVRAGNAEPEVLLQVTNGNKSFYWEGIPINYSIDVTDKEDGSLKNGQISREDVKITLAWSTMGTDLAMITQTHETLTSAEPDFELIKSSDCKSCHAMSDKSVGPSYVAIADRYKNDSATMKKLAAKIIAGGSGNWGEHAMSAHPLLSAKQATDIVAYILSLKDDAALLKPVPAEGKIVPGHKKAAEAPGEYILSVSYKDKEQPPVGSNTIRKNFHLRNPRIKAITADDDKGVAKTAESVVRFSEDGSWIMFRDMDLSGIRSITYELDNRQIGGSLSMHLDSPVGKQISKTDISQPKEGADPSKKSNKKLTAVLSPADGMHDLYIVYHQPQDEGVNIFNTLFLEWITFNK